MRQKILTYRIAILAGATALMFYTPPAYADGSDFTFSIQSVTANPNTTGDVFDVLLTNNTGSAVTIGGFSFGITTADTDITFTGADTLTAVDSYIFAGDSFDVINGFPLNTAPPPAGQILDASDFSNSGNGDSIGAGATLGLGEIFFNVANGATLGPATVSFDTTVTSLSDQNANSLGFDTTSGTVTIQSATTVPEPVTDGLCIFALAGFVFFALRRRAS